MPKQILCHIKLFKLLLMYYITNLGLANQFEIGQ